MVSHIVLNDSITLHYDGQTKVIAKGDERYDKVLKAIREKRESDIPEIADPELFFKRQGIDVEDGVLKFDGEAMPKELDRRVMAYKENQLPVESLLKFWEKLKQNPSFNSRQQLFKFLENKGHSICADGDFIGYRGVRDDFKDKHTGTFDNRPGQICEILRSAVDDNPANTCSHGLHVGGYEYAKDFGPKLVMVKVNPKDVVAVPNDYNGQKMRVCRFEVIKETQVMSEAVVFGDVKPLPKHQTAARPVAPSGKINNLSPKRKLQSYANNHAKRGPDGKFITKTKANRRAMAKKLARKARR